MRIEVLGPGCPRCHHTLAAVKQAVAELGLAAEVAYVTDLNEGGGLLHPGGGRGR